MRLSKAIDRFLAWRQLERDATPKSLDSYWRILKKLDEYLEARIVDARLTDLDGLAEVLDAADGLEVDFEPTPQGRRLLAAIGVTVREENDEQ